VSKRVLTIVAGVATTLVMTATGASAQKKELVIGAQCDRTGPTLIAGVPMCPAFHDYVDLVNRKGGAEGYKLRVAEIDTEYKVPQSVEAYERLKKEGALSILVWGTPAVQALTQKLHEDKIPGTSPGFGLAASADGQRYPYLFPVAATYWSQTAAAVKFVRDKLGGNLAGKKIAYIFYDNPAGREPLPVLEELQKIEKFELKIFAVPAPGLEVGAQVLDIAQRYRADFVISHLFGRAPSVSIKEFKRVGYPLSKVLGFVWASTDSDIDAAGGFAAADGYYTMHFAGVGGDYPVLKEIVDMYKAQGKPAPKEMQSSVYYNRGLLWIALNVEAVRNAIKAKGGQAPTPEDVKRGFEQIKKLPVGDIAPPLAITAADHEGGGWVQIFQVKGGKFQKASDWYRAYPEVVAKAVKEAK
jgi:branched-chain amino acid transport system substrate-binding protein